jgi:hypothetical protein
VPHLQVQGAVSLPATCASEVSRTCCDLCLSPERSKADKHQGDGAKGLSLKYSASGPKWRQKEDEKVKMFASKITRRKKQRQQGWAGAGFEARCAGGTKGANYPTCSSHNQIQSRTAA